MEPAGGAGGAELGAAQAGRGMIAHRFLEASTGDGREPAVSVHTRSAC